MSGGTHGFRVTSVLPCEFFCFLEGGGRGENKNICPRQCTYVGTRSSRLGRENNSNPKISLCTKNYREVSQLNITYKNHIVGEQIFFWPNTCRKSYILPEPRLCGDSRKHRLQRDVSHFYSERKKGTFIFFRSVLEVWKSTNLTFVKFTLFC